MALSTDEMLQAFPPGSRVVINNQNNPAHQAGGEVLSHVPDHNNYQGLVMVAIDLPAGTDSAPSPDWRIFDVRELSEGVRALAIDLTEQ